MGPCHSLRFRWPVICKQQLLCLQRLIGTLFRFCLNVKNGLIRSFVCFVCLVFLALYVIDWPFIFPAVEVFFTTSPKIIHTKRGIQVTGCSYNTSRHANVSSFWHVNGAVRIIQADVSKNNNSYAMSPLNIDSYDLIGWYKCVVFDNNIMLKAASSKNTTVLSVECMLF